MKHRHVKRQRPEVVAVAVLTLIVGGAWLTVPLSHALDWSLADPPTTTVAPGVTVIIATPESAEGDTSTTGSTTTFTLLTTTTLPPVEGTLPTTPTSPVPNTQPPPPDVTVPDLAVDAESEAEVAMLVDDVRESYGLPALPTSPELQEYARDQAWRMASEQHISHSDIGSLLDGWKSVGENIGTGGDASALVGALVASPSHLEVMLEDYEADGVGVVVDANGQLWVCHVFASTEVAVSITVPTLPVTIPRLPIN
jgi:uncharacterized protein YkwD